MVDATKHLVPIFVECNWGKENTDLSDKYNVHGYPTVIFTDATGKQVAEMRDRSPASLVRQITDVSTKYVKSPVSDKWETVSADAKKAGKKVLFFFSTGNDDSNKLDEALEDESNKDLVGQFVVAWATLKAENPDAKQFGIASSTGPVILVLDPAADKPEAMTLKKIAGKRTAKELRAEIESVTKKGA